MHEGHENKGNDHQLKNLLIGKQILLVNTLKIEWRTVRRRWIMILGRNGLSGRGHPWLSPNRLLLRIVFSYAGWSHKTEPPKWNQE